MVIVHVGSVVPQVEHKESRREFVEELIGRINERPQWVAEVH